MNKEPRHRAIVFPNPDEIPNGSSGYFSPSGDRAVKDADGAWFSRGKHYFPQQNQTFTSHAGPANDAALRQAVCNELTDELTNKQLGFSKEQHSLILSALHEKLLDTKRYVSSYAGAAGEPAASDLCCEFHEARFNQNKYSRQVLQEQVNELEGLIGVFDKLLAIAEAKEDTTPCPTESEAVVDEGGFCTAHGNDCGDFTLHQQPPQQD